MKFFPKKAKRFSYCSFWNKLKASQDWHLSFPIPQWGTKEDSLFWINPLKKICVPPGKQKSWRMFKFENGFFASFSSLFFHQMLQWGNFLIPFMAQLFVLCRQQNQAEIPHTQNKSVFKLFSMERYPAAQHDIYTSQSNKFLLLNYQEPKHKSNLHGAFAVVLRPAQQRACSGRGEIWK